MTSQNTPAFVDRTLALCRDWGLDVFVVGGWAEEFQGVTAPRSHHDVDLVVRTPSVHVLDQHLDVHMVGREVVAKRKPFKRAFILEGVLVELFVAVPDQRGWITAFPGGDFIWPDASFTRVSGRPVVTPDTLAQYRAQHTTLRPDLH